MLDKPRLAPHPRDLPVLGSLLRFKSDILQAILDGWRECGDVVRFRGPRPMCLVARPEYVQHVMQDRQDVYPRSTVVREQLQGIMGEGSFISSGELWKHQRGVWEPVVHSERVADFGRLTTDLANEMLGRWDSRGQGEVVDVLDEMNQLNLALTERLLFGAQGCGDSRGFASAVQAASEFVIPRIMAPLNLPARLTSAGRRYGRALRTLDALLHRAMDVRRRALAKGAPDSGDLLSMLVHTRNEQTGQGLSDQQVRDEAMTSAFGAYKGVANGLTWIWYLLSNHSEPSGRLSDELREVLGGRVPSVHDLPRLRYTRMIVQEALRLFPPLWIWSRQPVVDDEIGGYRIPAGMFVLVVPYVTHRHPAFWEEPESFEPERFTPERSAGRHPFAYFPFAAGPRRCIGEGIALMELCLVVATVAQRYRLTNARGHSIRRALEFVMRPSNGLPMLLESAN